MKFTVAAVSANGEIGSVFSPGALADFPDGRQMGDSLIKHLPADADPTTFPLNYVWQDNAWTRRAKRPTPHHFWEAMQWVLDVEQLFNDMRSDRDYRLQQSDWTQMPDAPLTEAQRAEWAAYRQALRDVPQDNQSATSLENVVWPTKPS
jgi:hypothetical protein